MLSYDTYQFNDYSRYDAAQIDEEHKAKVHERQKKHFSNFQFIGLPVPLPGRNSGEVLPASLKVGR